MSDRPDILYVLSHGFAARMVLHSELLGELAARGISVAVMSPSAADDHFRALATKRGARIVPAPAVGGRLLSQYAQARRYLFEDYRRNAALRSKHLWDLHHPTVHPVARASAIAGNAVNALSLSVPALPRALGSLEGAALRSDGLRTLLKEVRPRLVVATYPVAWLEALTILEARRAGIPTVGQLLSWDNITCKGRFAGVPDRFISWGPIMSQELEEFYGATGDRVIEAGVPHFDLHTRPVEPAVLQQHLARLGLDPQRPYLFFGMSAGYFAPKEVDIVAWLAQRVRRGDLGEGLQLLVRPHPQNIRGPMSDPAVVAKLRAIASGPVAVDLPDVVSDRLDMGEADMARLAALLSGAAVTCNSGSTLTIDAMVHDRPVVLTMFDADQELPYWESARRLRDFPHLEKLLAQGGTAVVGSFAELESAIRGYLADPTKDREARRRALHAECGPPDGKACERVAGGLRRILDQAS